jgi:hypothetical protein
MPILLQTAKAALLAEGLTMERRRPSNTGRCLIDLVTLIIKIKIQTNRPNMVQHYKKEKTCVLIERATPDDLTTDTKETEKLSTYKDLKIEFSRM